MSRLFPKLGLICLLLGAIMASTAAMRFADMTASALVVQAVCTAALLFAAVVMMKAGRIAKRNLESDNAPRNRHSSKGRRPPSS